MSFEPIHEWEGEIAGYTCKFAVRHVWRLGTDYAVEDLMQDGFILYMVCCKRYPVPEKRHFMALYKSCLRNHINTLSVKVSRRREVQVPLDEDENIIFNQVAAADDSIVLQLRWMFADAPEEIRQVLAAFEEGDNRKLRIRRWRGVRETTNRYLRRLGSLPKDLNIRQIIECWFEGESQCLSR